MYNNIRVYVAGAYSACNVLDVLKNIGKGEKLSLEVFKAGFCPWHDKDFIIHDPDFEYTVDMFYNYSLAWLEVSDCVLLVPGWENSIGTKKEIEMAKELKLKIYYSLEDLKNDYN
ncbi:MAG: DUF4406 domain-containing protein [Nitrosopumilaceae archaeon]|jgi:hypothetical protein